MAQWFGRLANRTSELAGHYLTFIVAILIVLLWAVSGPFFGFGDTWQLAINTGTTIVTFLMVFLIQNTQNRDAKAVHLKLDELIHATQAADDRMMAAEEQSDQELAELKQRYTALSAEHEELKRHLTSHVPNGH